MTERIDRRQFLRDAGLTFTTLALIAAGIPRRTFAAPARQENYLSGNSLDLLISKEPGRIGELLFNNGAYMHMAAPMLSIDENLELNTHTEWNEDINPPPFEASVVRANTGAVVTFLHSSYLLGNDGKPVELPGEPFRAVIEGNRRKGFYGDLQTRVQKEQLLSKYPIFTVGIDGKKEKFYVPRISIYNTRYMTDALVNDLFNSGDEDTLKIYTCGLSAHSAVDQCTTALSDERLSDNPKAQQALNILTNPESTSAELKDAVLGTCVDFTLDPDEKIVATYMGAKEIIVEEEVNGIIRRKRTYHNIPKADLEKKGIFYYTDRRIVWTLQRIK